MNIRSIKSKKDDMDIYILHYPIIIIISEIWLKKGEEKYVDTRLHSSRMRTARALTVSPSMLCAGGVCACSGSGVSGLGRVCLVRGVGELPGPGGCLVLGRGVPGPEGWWWYPSMH